jgi:cell division septum initiation protein DivIVA
MPVSEDQLDILRILQDLEDITINKPKSFGPIVFGLNKDEVQMQIAKVRASLPQELKAAHATMRESERIVDSAREDAHMTVENARKEADRVIEEARKETERMLEQARIQQERMLDESEILKLAKAQSEEIRNSAERDAAQLRRGADKYAYDLLSQLEGVMGKAMTIVERGKHDLERAEAQSQPQHAAVQQPLPNREKARV